MKNSRFLGDKQERFLKGIISRNQMRNKDSQLKKIAKNTIIGVGVVGLLVAIEVGMVFTALYAEKAAGGTGYTVFKLSYPAIDIVKGNYNRDR